MSARDAPGADRLNADCACITLEHGRLERALAAALGDPDFAGSLASTHPHLISAQPVFVSAVQVAAMQSLITAIETVAALPAYQSAVTARSNEIARQNHGPAGVFMGYDFHLGPDGPRLIEINTNAGGALINAYLLEAHRVCCATLADETGLPAGLNALLEAFLSSFRSEWRRQGRSGQPSSIAIVDRDPTAQYLYPEFQLFQRLFETGGMAAVIADPSELHHDADGLSHNGRRIDLVYNRLTDFTLSDPDSAALRASYEAGTVVVTPNPWVHAQLADKRNLALLSDPATLRSFGTSSDTIETLLAGIPPTQVMTADNAGRLWSERDHLFFKPQAGFGSKAAYRGDKITKKVWAEITAGDYVAQRIVPPSSRTVAVDGQRVSLKTDLRAFTYEGRIQLVSARLYSGQTTNFRTPGGGFAPVRVVDDVMQSCGCG